MARSKERAEFLQDVLITAVEGGTGYWAAVSGYRYDDDKPETASVTLHPLNDDTGEFDGPAHAVTIDTIAAGIGRIKRGDLSINSALRGTILNASDENDAGDIDADGADAIVQAALFGELVYG